MVLGLSLLTLKDYIEDRPDRMSMLWQQKNFTLGLSYRSKFPLFEGKVWSFIILIHTWARHIRLLTTFVLEENSVLYHASTRFCDQRMCKIAQLEDG